jgi:uncharacterized protein
MWIDRAVKWLLPREEHFYDLLERGAACSLECSTLLTTFCGEPTNPGRQALLTQMDEVESRADRVIAEVYEALSRTFVTPIDRSDIYTLANALEGIVDDIFATARQLEVHALDELPEGSPDLAELIGESCAAIDGAVRLLRRLKDPAAIRERCNLLARLEAEGDLIFRTRLGALYRTETDAIRLIKHKEFLAGLEQTLDVCNDVGNALETIVIKNA